MDLTNLQSFEDHIKNHILSEGFEFRKSDTEIVFTPEGLECAGFFDHKNRALNIASGTTDYHAILTHEYCHFLQYLDKHSYFGTINGNEDLLDKWFMGEIDLDQEEVDEFTQDIQLLELDCEIRTVRFLRRIFKYTPKELAEYIQEANLYIWFIRIASDLGEWNSLGVPQSHGMIKSMTPEDFISDNEISLVPKDIYNLTVQLCFEKETWYNQQLT